MALIPASDINTQVRDVLIEFRDIYRELGDQVRSTAFANASASISQLTTPLSFEYLANNKIAGVGKSIKDKITEFLASHSIKALEELKRNPELNAIRLFSTIMGVGIGTARTWAKMSLTTLNDLSRAVADKHIHLTREQLLGLTHYNDLRTRIPRNDVADIIAKVCAHIKSVDPQAVCEGTGSYRRGLQDSGDVDVLVASQTKLLTPLSKSIASSSDFVASLSVGVEKFSFLFKTAHGHVARVDVVLVAPESYFPALMYMTGDKWFNIYMRKQLKNKGYLLNQHGLYLLAHGKHNLVAVNSEQAIFATAGMKYLPPNRRQVVESND